METVRKKSSFLKRGDVDMTQGNIFSHLIRFAVPLLLGNVLQLLYNTVDSWVVGNYVSDQAFAAVGTVGPIMNLLVGFFLGLSAGSGVVISQYYGAKQEENVQKTVHTVLLMTFVLGVVFAVVGVFMTPLMVKLMNTPEDVVRESKAYLQIIFSGVMGLMVYNMSSGIMRAVGDSKKPFIFLAVSAGTNTALDLLFVLGFGWKKVEAVALATIIAQFISALLCIVTLMHAENCCKFEIKKLKINWKILKKVLKVGIPSGLQMAITSFSNVFVMSYINQFGTECMGGWTAYSKIDQFLLLPMQTISIADTTFVGQNLGVNQVDRAKKGVRTAIMMSMVCTITLMIPVLIFAPTLVTFFNKTPNVVKYGKQILRLISPFYVLCCINQIHAGALRGAGDSKAPMIIMVGSFVVFRQIYLFAMSRIFVDNFTAIALGYPAGWLVCSVILSIYFHRSHWEKYRIVEDEESAEQPAE